MRANFASTTSTIVLSFIIYFDNTSSRIYSRFLVVEFCVDLFVFPMLHEVSGFVHSEDRNIASSIPDQHGTSSPLSIDKTSSSSISSKALLKF